MTNQTAPDELVERLTRKAQLAPMFGSADSTGRSKIYDDGMRYVNPDGPEAATRIKELSAEVERLKQEAEDNSEALTISYMMGSRDAGERTKAAEARATKAEEALVEIRDARWVGDDAVQRIQGFAGEALGEGKV